MQITVSGHQMEITEPLRNYASEKIGRIQKHFDHVINTNIVLHVQKNQHKAEATIHVTGNNIFAECEDEDMYAAIDAPIHARGATLHADAEGLNMYAAIDSLADKLDRQVLKHKEKATSHHRNEGSSRKNETP